jgi:hypothetical protein
MDRVRMALRTGEEVVVVGAEVRKLLGKQT